MNDRGFSEVVTEPLPPRDHNQPPELLPTGEQLTNGIEAAHSSTFARAEDILAAGKRMPETVGDADTERKFTDFVRTIQACVKALEAARVGVKEPYLTAERAVDGHFKKQTEPLEALKAEVERRLTAYKNEIRRQEQARRDAIAAEARAAEQKAAREKFEREEAARKAAAERERLAREAREAEQAAARKRNEAARAEAARIAQQKKDELAAAERVQREADEAAAAARATAEETANERADAEGATSIKPAEITRARGDFSVGSLQEFVDYRDVIVGTLDLERLREHIGQDALEKAVKAYVRANTDFVKGEIKNGRQPVRGVTFFLNHRTRVT